MDDDGWKQSGASGEDGGEFEYKIISSTDVDVDLEPDEAHDNGPRCQAPIHTQPTLISLKYEHKRRVWREGSIRLLASASGMVNSWLPGRVS